MSTSLSAFIAHARSKNMDHQTIRMLLLSAGWKEKDIASALASESLTMSIPLPGDVGSARDAFFHLLAFTTLYATVISLVILAFTYIGRWFPDPALMDYAYASSGDFSSIRWSIAVIVISFPMFLFLSRILHREFQAKPEKLNSGVRRWLTYLTLFVTSCALIGDGITLLFTLLSGELTLRFVLKVLAVLVLSGLPFGYYFTALRIDHEQYAKSSIHAKYLWSSVAIVLVFLLCGIVIVGSPMQGRAEKFDEQRISDLRAIQNEIYNVVYGQERGVPVPAGVKVLPKTLPKDLQTVAANALYEKLRIADPETTAPYVYKTRGTSFELCATFALERDLGYDIFWNHPASEKCFEFDALDQRTK
ncbi:hypothetical protein EXS65_01840 [Candidatus Peribacteria bacterium]|nr:hypothetical protein [Candidatus Peribacteria bacterium]